MSPSSHISLFSLPLVVIDLQDPRSMLGRLNTVLESALTGSLKGETKSGESSLRQDKAAKKKTEEPSVRVWMWWTDGYVVIALFLNYFVMFSQQGIISDSDDDDVIEAETVSKK